MSDFECKGERCLNFQTATATSCDAIGTAIGALRWGSDPETGSYDTTEACPKDVLGKIAINKPTRAALVLRGAERIDAKATKGSDDTQPFRYVRAAQVAAEAVKPGNYLEGAAAADIMRLSFQLQVQNEFPDTEVDQASHQDL